MKSSHVVLALVAFCLAACSRSPEELCEDFVDECEQMNSVDQCIRRADDLERRAEEAGCTQPYYDYLDCVDGLESLCNTADDCALPRDDLARCGVDFE